MTKRILKKGDLVIPKREGNSSLDGDEDEENSYDEKIIRDKKIKRPPNPPVASSGSESEPGKGGVSDADTEASEEKKYLPDYWLLTRHVLIRVHNTPRRKLATPNEDPNDPSPIPIRFNDIMRRTSTSSASKAEAIIEDHWVDEDDAHRELTDDWIGQTMFYLRKPACERKRYTWQNCRETRKSSTSKRPPIVWVEQWPNMHAGKQQAAILPWGIEGRRSDVVEGIGEDAAG